MKISAIQLLIDDRRPSDRERAAVRAVEEEAGRGARMVVLPELWRSGVWAFEDYHRLAEPLDGPFVSGLASLAARAGVWLHAGTVLERDGDDVFNTAVLLEPDGSVAATYRKMHLFGHGSREPELIGHGDEVVVTDVDGGRLGLATCYDLRFPELFRALVDRGAEAVVLPAGWPIPRLEAWRTLGRARAIENQIAYVACNSAGAQRSLPFVGNSVAYDAWGSCLGELSEAPGVLRVDLDIEAVRAARANFRQLDDRRDRLGEEKVSQT